MFKKKFLPAIAVFSVFALMSTGIYAYMTGAEQSGNIITVGQIRTEITETFPEITDDIYQKTVKIENTGNSPCFVRVFLGVSDSESEQVTGFGDTENGPWYSANVNIDNEGITTGVYEKTYVEHLENLDNGWTYIPMSEESAFTGSMYSANDKELLGGWYYYKNVLKPEESTTSLLQYVNTFFDSLGENADFDIILYQESIQILDKNGADFNPENGEPWLQAWKESISQSISQ